MEQSYFLTCLVLISLTHQSAVLQETPIPFFAIGNANGHVRMVSHY